MITKANKLFLLGILGCGIAMTMTSCEDFFDQESDHVMFSDHEHLNNATDTIYSVTGILKKLQFLADRTILLGEARADLVDITDATSSDLRDVALFNIGDDNIYNQPRDYYAVINNCNYFIAHCDTSLINSRNEHIFRREYAAVKAFRAWTYLQLAMNYGKVPFITEPILTKEEAESYEQGHFADITTICDWLIKDLMPLTQNDYIQEYDEHSLFEEYPRYGDIGYKTDSRLFFFPIPLLLGELNLWAGHDREAALWYYRYITNRNGNTATSVYPTGLNSVKWMNTNWSVLGSDWTSAVTSETYASSGELITMIPGDSIPYNGNYLQLRNIFNSSDPVTGEYHEVSLKPSRALIDLSAAQTYCYVKDNDTIYAPEDAGFDDYQNGDLRLYATFSTGYTQHNSQRVQTQRIAKYQTRNAHIWRRQMVWLHMAEALNRAGFPRFAYQILARGVNNSVLSSFVLPYYQKDSTYLRQFNLPSTDYVIASPLNVVNQNTQGIHTRGSGWSTYNAYYQMPDDPSLGDTVHVYLGDTLYLGYYLDDTPARTAYQQERVEQMIADEGALEFAFEGLRYYDLMRMAIRRNDPAFLADRVYGRRGEQNSDAMKAEIRKDLYNQNSWYLSWQGKIGLYPIQEPEP